MIDSESILQFKEVLPPTCPTLGSADQAWGPIYRLMDSPQPGPDVFKSYAALGMAPTASIVQSGKTCEWAACSLVRDPAKQKKLPRFRETHHWAARLVIPLGAGLSKASKNSNHVDFWCERSFDMHQAVVRVVTV